MKNTKIKTQISLAKICRLFVAASFAVLLVLSYLFTNPTKGNSVSSVFAEGIPDTPATSGVPVDDIVVLNLDLTHSNALLELTPHDSTGTFSSSSEDDSVAFNVSTNNYTGYTLYISSSSNDGYLSSVGITTPTTENSLSSIDEITTESDFSNPSSTTLNNKWGYKPSKYNGSDNTSFIPAPTTIPTALDTTSTYDTTKDGELITSETDTEDINTNTYTIGLGARVDSTIPTGAYAATFNLSVVGNPVPVTIYYQDISNDATVDNLPETYEGAASETRSPISTTTPTRTGYTFISWCLGEVTPGTSENDFLDTCTGTTYAASNPTDGTQYVGIDRTKNNIITLKAMWRRDKYMQTVQIRYQGTDGDYSDYTDYADCTTELYYGDTHSCSIDANIEYKAASIASYTVTGAEIKQITVDRQKYAQTIQARYQGTDGNYGSYSTYDACTADVFYGATHSCSYTATAEYKAASVASYTVTGANTKQMDVARQIYTQTIQVRYQNTSGGWGSYGNYASCTKDIYYGVSHSCSIAATAEYKAASVASYTVTGANTKQMDIARQTYTQTIQIRYQNASGGWGSYSNYSSCTKAVYYGASHSCSVAADTTYAATSVASYTVTGANTKYMDAYRNTRTVSLTKGTGVSSVVVTGTGVKSGSNTASATVYYGGAVTITATMSSGYDWVNWTGSSTYTNRAQSISSVTSNLSLTGNGKAYTYMQNVTTSSCPTSRTYVHDSRDNKGYYIQKIGSVCWMTSDLNLAGGTTLTSSTSNVSSNYKLPASSTNGFGDISAYVYNSGNTNCSSGPCSSYYSYVAATAGTGADLSSGDSTYDICPKGWRLPTEAQYNTLIGTYNTIAKITGAPWYASYNGTMLDGAHTGGNGWDAYYWTSTLSTKYYAKFFYFDAGGNYFHVSNAHKAFGNAVRCVAK